MKLQGLIDFVDSYRLPLMVFGAVVLGGCLMAIAMIGGFKAVTNPEQGTRKTIGSTIAILLCGLILGLGPIILGLVIKAAKADPTKVDLKNIGAASSISAPRVPGTPSN